MPIYERYNNWNWIYHLYWLLIDLLLFQRIGKERALELIKACSYVEPRLTVIMDKDDGPTKQLTNGIEINP